MRQVGRVFNVVISLRCTPLILRQDIAIIHLLSLTNLTEEDKFVLIINSQQTFYSIILNLICFFKVNFD